MASDASGSWPKNEIPDTVIFVNRVFGFRYMKKLGVTAVTSRGEVLIRLRSR